MKGNEQSNVHHASVDWVKSDPQIPALKERVIAHADYLSLVIATSRQKIVAIEAQMSSKLGSLSPEGSRALLQVRRIISAVEGRLDRLTAALNESTDTAIYGAVKLTLQEIAVPHDAVHALITEAPPPPINPQTLQHTLSSLFAKMKFTRAERSF
ncbi:MAG: hypothetical protein U0136_00225 [Bdellovibrionota bacterium]